jgi:Fe-S oxidoreductase
MSQVHCHHHAVLGDWQADAELLARAGVEVERLDSGCCGLAGNFGFEAGHLEVSKACAEQVLLPAVRAADPEVVVLADGFSCRTQISELDSGGREAVHLAELLDRGRQGAARPAQHGDLAPGDRPTRPSVGERAAVIGLLALAGWVVKGVLER